MPINREPEAPRRHEEESSAVRRAPLDLDDAHELQEHEFTLEPDEANPAAGGGAVDEHTAPWSTHPLPPLPPWAATARALLEAPSVPSGQRGVFIDDQPTPTGELVACSAIELMALREELVASRREAGALREKLAIAVRESSARIVELEQLEQALSDSRTALSAREAHYARALAESEGRARGRGWRVAELEQQLVEIERDLRAAHARRPAAEPLELVEPNAGTEHAAEVHPVAAAPSDAQALAAAAEGSPEVTSSGRQEPSLATADAGEPPAPEPGASEVRALARASRSPGRSRRDVLTEIHGIGPRFADKLCEFGVVSIARIAAWTAADVTRIAEQLGISPKRIRKERWVAQARRLHARKARARAARAPARR